MADRYLEDEVACLEPSLAKVLLAIAAASASVAETLRASSTDRTGGRNEHGDLQLGADVAADEAVFEALRSSGVVAVAASEERAEDAVLLEAGGTTSPGPDPAAPTYSVAFDPLDGSSVVAASWAVGSIFGVWPGRNLRGVRGDEQVAAAYAVHGPRTSLVVARPRHGGHEGEAQVRAGAGGAPASPYPSPRSHVVQEFLLSPSGAGARWHLARDELSIPRSAATFAPANLRASADLAAYRGLVDDWISRRLTLRYSGALVPDVHHVLTKGGVFASPASAGAPAKLRLLVEVAPIAFVVEAAGGASDDGRAGARGGETAPARHPSSPLCVEITSHGQRSQVCLGSTELVDEALEAMAEGDKNLAAARERD